MKQTSLLFSFLFSAWAQPVVWAQEPSEEDAYGCEIQGVSDVANVKFQGPGGNLIVMDLHQAPIRVRPARYRQEFLIQTEGELRLQGKTRNLPQLHFTRDFDLEGILAAKKEMRIVRARADAERGFVVVDVESTPGISLEHLRVRCSDLVVGVSNAEATLAPRNDVPFVWPPARTVLSPATLAGRPSETSETSRTQHMLRPRRAQFWLRDTPGGKPIRVRMEAHTETAFVEIARMDRSWVKVLHPSGVVGWSRDWEWTFSAGPTATPEEASESAPSDQPRASTQPSVRCDLGPTLTATTPSEAILFDSPAGISFGNISAGATLKLHPDNRNGYYRVIEHPFLHSHSVCPNELEHVWVHEDSVTVQK